MSESTERPPAVDPAYRRLPTEGPDAPDLGGALITWVEPMPEHVVAYNRWYEDDHMITGAMSMPWMFSCRRWVAPRSIQHLRGPADTTVAVPLDAGKYIGVYWVNGGRIEDHTAWSLGANHRLHAEGRGSCRGAGHDPLEERRHVFTAFADHLGSSYRDDTVPRSVHTLVQPYAGMVIEMIEALDGDRSSLDGWIEREHLAAVLGGPVAVTVRFAPRPLPPDRLAHVIEVDGVERMVVLLHFLESDPLECWEERFAPSADRLASGGVGSLAVQAAFIPTKHGTDAYTDELF
jgi:hypothetical protein